uniref:ITPR interacting domain containing 2 n=1 Tax=Anas platyrhynchos platyrhynchos TaxID=8840 RepID=U3IYH2_ANAPP
MGWGTACVCGRHGTARLLSPPAPSHRLSSPPLPFPAGWLRAAVASRREAAVAMDEPPAAEEWQGATQKRKAWAKSRDSWQASEAEDFSAAAAELARGEEEEEEEDDEEEEEEEEDHAGSKLPPAAEAGQGGGVPNEKIAIWLKDCRWVLPLLLNGGSFEDDLSLGAEGGLVLSICVDSNGMLAKERRLQFHQKGRSMNSTGSGKSSATVSSVSELLELYEEDPEEVLYNLGFGRDEPDIASKIPARFFNSSSFARGIDIKVFLNAQMQRMEVENPNFALTSRFRQIEVLTTVANAFSSLYSQVSGTPLQKIGSMNSVSSSKEASSPPPLNRSNTASRLMKTLSKLNLCSAQQADGSGCPIPSPVEKGKSPAELGSEENDAKNESKLQKHSKKKDSPSFLATVKEEIASSLMNATDAHKPASLPAGTDDKQENTVPAADVQNSRLANPQDRLCEESSLLDSSNLSSSSNTSNSSTSESSAPTQRPPVASPCVPLANPSIMNLMLQQKDSFEMEELGFAFQHSDSSGFAEDSSTDCSPFNQLQVQESLQGMGSSADSCDSETTVTSHSEEQKTPIAKELPCFNKDDKKIHDYETEQNGGESKSSYVLKTVAGEVRSKEEHVSSDQKELELLEEGSDESDVDKDNVFEFPQYQTHHILKSLESLEGGSSSPSSVDRVHVALQRAQMRIISTSDSRAGRAFLKSKDLLRKQRQWLAESGYPLRRSQSLPTALLNPVKVVSSVNVQLAPGKETLCGPPSFTYKYTGVEEDEKLTSEDDKQEGKAAASQPVCKSTLFIAPSSSKKEVPQAGPRRQSEEPSPTRGQSCPLHTPAHMSQSTCSLHSLPTEWQDRPLCEHVRTLSTHSVPSISGSSFSSLLSPFSCPFSPRHSGYPHRPHAINPPSTVEMQLRRVLHDIRNSLQNLSQYPVMRGQDSSAATGYTTQRSSILPLYENTFQELQVVRRNLNLFRTQMMDLELAMLRQQTTVYQHMTEEERYEADQLQSLRKSVRMELQELEMQLEERLLALEDQLRSLLFRSQSFLKSELGLGLGDLGLETLPAEGTESVFSHGNSDSSSVCSTASRKAGAGSSEQTGKSKSQSKKLYRASVALTPAPPVRAGTGQQVESSEELADSKLEVDQKLEKVPRMPSVDEIHKSVEQEELQQVIREIKESIVGEIRREIVSGLLAAVSPQSRSATAKQDAQP